MERKISVCLQCIRLVAETVLNTRIVARSTLL